MNWDKLKREYIAAYSATNMSLRDWCRIKNISYHTARRYIKVHQVKKLHRSSSTVKDCASEKLCASGLTRHGGYSQFIAAKYTEAAQQVQGLRQELLHARSLLAHQSDRLYWFNQQMDNQSNLNDKLALFKSMSPLYELVDRTMGRVASLELSIARIEQVQASIEREKAQTALLQQTLQQRRINAESSLVSFRIDW